MGFVPGQAGDRVDGRRDDGGRGGTRRARFNRSVWIRRMAKSAGRRKAKVALARKLAVVLHLMLAEADVRGGQRCRGSVTEGRSRVRGFCQLLCQAAWNCAGV
jgi:hypothetical protein